MTENDIMAELSYAYLHAVAARAGFGCSVESRIDDGASVDAYVIPRTQLLTVEALREVALRLSRQEDLLYVI